MQTVYQNCRQFRLGGTLTKLRRVKSPRHYSTRGRLPWESPSKFPEQPHKKFRKRKIEPIQEKYCPYDCEVLKRPLRNTYEWVVEEDVPCRPYGLRHIVRTVCETRKYQKCLEMFSSFDKCRNVTPDCSKIKKLIPMRETIQKGSLPGCVRPVATK